jgi:hypothetical protein
MSGSGRKKTMTTEEERKKKKMALRKELGADTNNPPALDYSLIASRQERLGSSLDYTL